MPRSSSRTNVPANKANKRGSGVLPTSSFKSSTKQTPSVSEKSAIVASKIPARPTTAPTAAAASRKPPATPQLWLMKTDPDYMVDKLVKDVETTWTGVRGYEARNLLRDHFRVGDKVLFYHSGDPKHMSALSAGKIKEPGIAAVCALVKEAFPETGAPLNSKGEVQWYSVGLRLERTISPQLSLQQLRAEPLLAGMDLFLRSRLSIQRVHAAHWNHIMTMAGLEKSLV